jgi:hypothetical protein
MKWSLLALAVGAVLVVAGSAFGQFNAQTALVLPPYTNPDPVLYTQSEVVRVVPFEPTGTVAPWGATEDRSTDEMLFSEIRQPFVVQRRAKDLTIISSINLAMPSSSLTGIAYDEKNDTIWGIDIFGNTVWEFNKTTGALTGNSWPIPAGGNVGPCTIDLNDGLGGDTLYYEDIAADKIRGMNIRTGQLGTCIHDNPLGPGTYGNGLSASYAPTFTGELWATSGSGTAGQPTDIFVGNPCFGQPYQQYVDLVQAAPNETFWQEIHHTVDPDVEGTFVWYAVGGSTNNLFEIKAPKSIEDCQGKDGENVLFVNGHRDNRISIIDGWPYHFGIQKPSGGGNGKYLVHMNSGGPIDTTITALPAGLGEMCFSPLIPPFGPAAPVSVWNNIGQTQKVGASDYFGTGIPDPPNAPAFFQQSVVGDSTNLPVGAEFTLQGVIINPAASSPKNASVTNGILLTIESQP